MKICEECNKRKQVISYKDEKENRSFCFTCFMSDTDFSEKHEFLSWLEEEENIELPITIKEGRVIGYS